MHRARTVSVKLFPYMLCNCTRQSCEFNIRAMGFIFVSLNLYQPFCFWIVSFTSKGLTILYRVSMYVLANHCITSSCNATIIPLGGRWSAGRADLDTSFLTLKKVHLNLKFKYIYKSPSILAVFCLIFNRLLKTLFLRVLLLIL